MNSQEAQDRLDALDRLAKVVHNKERHVWYNRTVELANLYRTLVTGDGLDNILKQFVQREDDKSFEQRKALTQHVVTTTVKNLMDTTYKVPRANYQRILQAKDTNASTELEGVLSKFWGDKSLDDYIKVRWLEVNSTDPNAWVIVEFDDFDNNTTRAQPYPYEVCSHDAVDLSFDNNVLESLTVREAIPIPTLTAPKAMGEKYTVYLENETFSLEELPSDNKVAESLNIQDGTYWMDPNGTGGYFYSKKRLFVLVFNTPHNAGFVPAKRFGYQRDPWSNGFTYTAPYNAAVPLLLKSIKVNSEMDLTMALSAFPFRIEYAPKCDATDCYNGYTTSGTTMCQVCKGTGHKTVVSAQEKLVLTLPKSPDMLFDLDKLVVFKHPPVDILNFQQDYVSDLTDACKAAMYNTDMFTKQKVAVTATEHRIDLNNVYDTLFTCALGMGEVWCFLVKACANFTQLDEGLKHELIFAKDFKLKGLSELLLDLESANRSEAGPEVSRAIQMDLARLIFADNPFELSRWETKNKINPFAGYNDAQVSLAISDPAVPKRYKVLYLMLGAIFDEIEMENTNFYLLPMKEQRRLIDEKVQKYIDETAGSNMAIPIKPMPMPLPPAPSVKAVLNTF